MSYCFRILTQIKFSYVFYHIYIYKPFNQKKLQTRFGNLNFDWIVNLISIRIKRMVTLRTTKLHNALPLSQNTYHV